MSLEAYSERIASSTIAGFFQMRIMLKNSLWRPQICWQRGEWDWLSQGWLFSWFAIFGDGLSKSTSFLIDWKPGFGMCPL